MSSTSSSKTDPINISVEVSTQGGNNQINLNKVPLSTTVGELKTLLKVRANSRLGRSNKYENWDNRRTLSDYFVKNGETFDCVVQCVIEEGQGSYDDYNEWLSANKDLVN